MGRWRSHIKCFACININICPFHHKTCWRKSPETSKSSRGPKDIIIKSNNHFNNFIGYRSVYVASKIKEDGHGTCQATTLLLWLPPEAATQHDNIRLQISACFWKHFKEILIPMIFWIDIYIYIYTLFLHTVYVHHYPTTKGGCYLSECPCHMFQCFHILSPSWKGSKRFKSPWSSKKTLAAAALRSDESRGKIIRFKFHQSISRSTQLLTYLGKKTCGHYWWVICRFCWESDSCSIYVLQFFHTTLLWHDIQTYSWSDDTAPVHSHSL